MNKFVNPMIINKHVPKNDQAHFLSYQTALIYDSLARRDINFS